MSILGLVLSVILLYYNARKFPASIFLGAFFFLVSLYGFVQWVQLYSSSPVLVGIFYMNLNFLAYLIGPLNYWYVRSTLKDDFRLKKRDLWHFLPAAVMLVISLPYMFTTWDYKIGVATEIIKDLDYLILIKPTVLHKLMPNSYVYLSHDLLIFIYLVFSVRLFIRYLKEAQEKSIIFGQGYMTKWITVFLVFSFILVTSHTAVLGRAIFLDDVHFVNAVSILQHITAIGLTGLVLSPLFFPEILYGLPRFPNQFLKERKESNGHQEDPPKKQMAPLEAAYLSSIRDKLERCMAEQRPYLSKDFNLTELSVLVRIPVHHLAYFFREEKGQSFTNYRNRWRIEHAKGLIHKGRAKELTLEAIGTLSGFSSRASFITAFKRFEGVPPHDYVSRTKVTSD